MLNNTQKKEKDRLESLLKETKTRIQKLEEDLAADEANALVLLTQLSSDLIELGKGACKGTIALFSSNDKKEEEENSISVKDKEEEGSGGGGGSLATAAELSTEEIWEKLGLDKTQTQDLDRG